MTHLEIELACANGCMQILAYCVRVKADISAQVFLNTLVPYYIALGGTDDHVLDAFRALPEDLRLESYRQSPYVLPRTMSLKTVKDELLEIVRKPYGQKRITGVAEWKDYSEWNSSGAGSINGFRAIPLSRDSNGAGNTLSGTQPAYVNWATLHAGEEMIDWRTEVFSPFNFQYGDALEEAACVKKMVLEPREVYFVGDGYAAGWTQEYVQQQNLMESMDTDIGMM